MTALLLIGTVLLSAPFEMLLFPAVSAHAACSGSATGITMVSQADIHAARLETATAPLPTIVSTSSQNTGATCLENIRKIYHVTLTAPSFSWSNVLTAMEDAGNAVVADAIRSGCTAAENKIQGYANSLTQTTRKQVAVLTNNQVTSPVQTSYALSTGPRIVVTDPTRTSVSSLRTTLSSRISTLTR